MSNGNGILYLRAQTSVHPGAGSSVGAIDLPVQRERYTGWPTIQGSSLKGVLREAFRVSKLRANQGQTRRWADEQDDLTGIFGKTEGDTGNAGTVAVSDARILAFPVRSARGVFAWVTCPEVLNRLTRDSKMAGGALDLPELASVSNVRAIVSEAARDTLCFTGAEPSKLLLEDLLLEADVSRPEIASKVAAVLAKAGAANAAARLAIISDDAFTHFVKHCTEVATRIALDFDTKRVKGTALFVIEMLPAETLLYSVLLAAEKRGSSAEAVGKIKTALGTNALLQIGGEETTGKGWCWAALETMP